jgi:hypothetical protein
MRKRMNILASCAGHLAHAQIDNSSAPCDRSDSRYTLSMGDRKPKKTSSGKGDAHKAKLAKHVADRATAKPEDRARDKKK